jgi:ribonuclease D
MADLPFPLAEYIDTQDGLVRLVETLSNEPLLAIDTESNSLYAYQERVCLIQLSTRTADYIIDPLVIDDLTPLAPLLAAEHIEKVFHAAEYDILCMKRDFGFTFANIFDTMVAARICGYKAVGLGSLLEGLANVDVDKSHQRDDWGKRPLSKESLHYAQIDTHYLPLLRDKFCEQLRTMNRLAEARETFAEICELPAAVPREFDADGYWRIAQPNYLKPRQLLVLRELYHLRERIAQKRDVPPFRVMSNTVLLALALAAPASMNGLKAIRGFSGRQAKRYGTRILRAIKQGKLNREYLTPPRPDTPDPAITERYAALHAWRKERALRRGVESDVIISKQTLWDLALKAPSTTGELQEIRGIGEWRLTYYGHEILDVLAQCKQPERG